MMKKLLYPLMTALLLFSANFSHAQVYSDWGLSPTGSVYDTITKANDTLRFQFSNCPAGAFGSARLVVYFEGDFSDNLEILNVKFSGASSLSTGPYDSLGVAGPNTVLVNCAAEDSTVLGFSIDTINAYAPNIGIVILPSANVGTQCTRNRVRVHLTYNFCTFGVPVEFASLVLSDSVFCPLDAGLALSGSPAGGTYSGPGINGSTFTPYGLAAGNYTITYTAADSIGCISSTTATVTVSNTPFIKDTNSCAGIPLMLSGSNENLIWYSDAALTNPIDSGTFTTPGLYTTTSYYAAYSCTDYYFKLDTLLSDSINIINGDPAGDDEGGIAVTKDFVFYNGASAFRYNTDMSNPRGPLPQRYGMFSDLATGILYTLWNSTNNSSPSDNNTTFNLTAVRTLDTNLALLNGITMLSQPIQLGNVNPRRTGIFAGAGILGLYSGVTQHFYVVNLCNGDVKDLGFNANPLTRATETWADWGIMEYDGTNYFAVYRNSTGNDIIRLQVPAGPTTSVGTFPAGIADMACITYSPWNKNWYFHYEGASGALGGTTETTGYANASDSMSALPLTVGCAEEVKVNISNINLGTDTSLCQQNYVLFAGTGYSTYTWNGVNSNFNSYTATGTDTVVFQGLYSDGCNHLDTVIVTMNPLPVVNLGSDITACGGPVTLDAGNAGATYLWNDSSAAQTLIASASGTYMVTVTDANGCEGSDDVNVTINANPVVSLAMADTFVCINETPFNLTGGTPSGGTYSGTGVSNGIFIPSFAGAGSFAITYNFTDANGCSGSGVQNIVVDLCTGIDNLSASENLVTVTPNPGNGLFVVQSNQPGNNHLKMEVVDVEGRMVYFEEAKSGLENGKQIDLSFLSEGVYVMKIYSDSQEQKISLIIQK